MAVVSTLAEVFTQVHQGLGAPTDLDLIQVKRAVHEACALYWTELIQSDQNQVIQASASLPFTSDVLIYPLTLTDMTMPDWVEIQVGSDQGDWQLVDVVNRDSLPTYRRQGRLACSFYSQLVDNALVSTIEFAYTPFDLGSDFNNFRIWYDPTIVVNTDDQDPTGFPKEYNYLIATEAKLSLIPICIQNEIKVAKIDKTDKDILSAQIGAWKMLLEKLGDDRVAWQKKWKFYCDGSRISQGGGKKRYYMDTGYL